MAMLAPQAVTTPNQMALSVRRVLLLFRNSKICITKIKHGYH